MRAGWGISRGSEVSKCGSSPVVASLWHVCYIGHAAPSLLVHQSSCPGNLSSQTLGDSILGAVLELCNKWMGLGLWFEWSLRGSPFRLWSSRSLLFTVTPLIASISGHFRCPKYCCRLHFTFHHCLGAKILTECPERINDLFKVIPAVGHEFWAFGVQDQILGPFCSSVDARDQQS